MTMVSCGIVPWPTLPIRQDLQSSTFGANNITVDSDTDRIAWVGRAPYTDTLTTLYFRTGTVTTGATFDVRIETVTNGRPSGTLFAANTNISVVVADGDDNVWKTATFTAAPSFTVGDEFAIIFVVDTAGATPNMQFAVQPSGTVSMSGTYPLCLQDAGAGTWASGIQAWEWIAEFGTLGVAPVPGLIPVTAGGTITSYDSASTPDEIALRFQVPFKCRVSGIQALLFNIEAGGDFTASLWDAAGDIDAEALAQTTEDGDVAISTTADGIMTFFFASPVTLTANTTYYAGIRADTANNIGLGEMSNSTVTNAMRALVGYNAQCYRGSRSWTAGTAGAWTDVTTTVPMIALILDQLDDGAGGGGLLTHPGMSGGMRG